MTKFSLKKLVSAVAISLSLALTLPAMLPVANNIVTVEAAKPKLSKKQATLLTGQTLKLKVTNKGKKSVKWSTSKSKVAKVKNGRITAVGKGKAVITAKVGNKKLKCKITVKTNQFKGESYKPSELESGYFYHIPTKVYYKNGKLYCKADYINKGTYSKIIKLTDKKKRNQLKMTLTARTFTTLTSYRDTVLAKGTIKKGLPTNISYNSKKSFTVVFSGKQIKKKGFDLSSADDMMLDFGSYYYWY
jgi:hypothetical protein